MRTPKMAPRTRLLKSILPIRHVDAAVMSDKFVNELEEMYSGNLTLGGYVPKLKTWTIAKWIKTFQILVGYKSSSKTSP